MTPATPPLGPILVGLSLLCASVPAKGLDAQTPDAPDDELLSRMTDRYEAYAPTPEELEVVVTGLERAVAHFERTMGETPPKVAFVLYATETQREAYDQDELGVPTYAISNRRPSGRSLTVFPELGLVLDGEQGQPAVVRAVFPGAGEATLRQGDVIATVDADEMGTLADLVAARQSWETGDELALGVTRQGETVEVEMVFPGRGAGAAAPREALSAAMAYQPTRAPDPSFVAHEATHRMVFARFGSVGSWFQEGFASLAELPEGVVRRRAAMVAGVDDAIPWDRYFSMPHPASAAYQERVRSGDVAVGGAVTVEVEGGVGLFYSQGLTVLEYVREVGGSEAIARLAAWLGGGGRGDAFPLPLDGDPDATLADHEEAWRVCAHREALREGPGLVAG